MVGTGIFATPSGILELSGSVGLALFLWVAGMIIAAAGMAVYLEFGTGIPKNGGEKNYLEYVFKKPRFLATGLYTGYVMLLGTFDCRLKCAVHFLTSLQVGPVQTPSSSESISFTLPTLKLVAGTSVVLDLHASLPLS